MCARHPHSAARYSHLRHVRLIHDAAIGFADPTGQLDPVDCFAEVFLKTLAEQLLSHALIRIEVCKNSTCFQNKIKGIW